MNFLTRLFPNLMFGKKDFIHKLRIQKIEGPKIKGRLVIDIDK